MSRCMTWADGRHYQSEGHARSGSGAVLRPGQAGQQRRWRAVGAGWGVELARPLPRQVAASAQAAAVLCVRGALVGMASDVVEVAHGRTAPGVATGLVASDKEGAQGTGEESFAIVPIGQDTGDRVGVQPSHPDGRREVGVRGSAVPTLLLGRVVLTITITLGLGPFVLARKVATRTGCWILPGLRGRVGRGVPWS